MTEQTERIAVGSSDDCAQEGEGDIFLAGAAKLDIVDAIPVPVYLTGIDGRFKVGNTAFYQLTSYAPAQLVNRDVYTLMSPAAGPAFVEIDHRLAATGENVSHEGVIVLADGSTRPVVFRKTLIRTEGKESVGILTVLLDLSELDAVKVALLASENEKQAILDGFPGLLALFDVDEKAIWVNDYIRQMHPDPVGRSCHEIFCRRNEMCGACAILLSLASGKVETTTQQMRTDVEGGEDRIIQLTGTPVRNSAGQVVSIVVIGHDMTEQVKLEKQLRHTQKMEAIGTLAGGIAHDFNNVLTPIMGYSEIIRLKMRQDGLHDSTILDYLEEILRAAKRAKNLVEQILTFSRSIEQKESLQYLHPIVKEVMKLMRVTLPSTITIREAIDSQCGMVSVDPVQIHQILINLCTNSAHAMAGRHGSLTVTLEKAENTMGDQEWLLLSVVDTGCGIEPDMLERIFEPYFTTKEKSRGTGMGLAMVHGIISQQGGRVEVESEVGVGTTFRVYLPVSKKKTRIDQVLSSGELIRGTGRILLVDDDPQIVQVTGELLSNLGYTVTGKTSPSEALALLSDDPAAFDLLLTDLTMPELTGIELCRKTKTIRPNLPVVLFTGYSEQLSRDEADEAGVSQYCMKPVSMRELAMVMYATLLATA